MEIYNTEEQQVEAIKRFWKENGLAIAAGVVLGLGGLYGWRYYQSSQLEKTMTQSQAYSQLLEKAQADDSTELAQQFQSFVDTNADSSYAMLAAFVAAKEAVEKKDYAAAVKSLNFVVSSAKQPEMKALAQLRLARVQLEQKDHAAALSTLAAALPEAFKAQQEELKGDALLQAGEAAKAKTAYLAAQSASKDSQSPILKVKLDELAHVTAA
ncbi:MULTISPECIES: YfgM family protein [Rheinheimera]|uniref:Ancillary SecYEG translocon subunit n=1 Tax=Rheinheimera marina TaxID=1774958 RepID=A0ABV9JPS1_9GAMM